MKKSYRIISMILAMLTVVTLLVSCKKGNEPDNETSDNTETQRQALDIEEYMLIRSEGADQTVIEALNSLRKSIKSICGVDIKATTDWIDGEIPIDSKEILIGDTNRRKADGLKSRDFQIKREGSKIYLLGGSSEAVQAAVDYFAVNYINESGLSIPDGTDYKHADKYNLENVYFGSVKIEKIKYYGTLINKNNTVAQSKLLESIEDAVGYEVARVNSEAEANLVLDETSTNKLPDGKWGTITEDGKLTVIGGGAEGRIQVAEYVANKFEAAEEELKFEVGTFSEKVLKKDEYLSDNVLQIYPEFSEKINRDYTYSVSVSQGTKISSIPVYNHVAVSPQTVNYDEADNYRRFATFAFCGERVRVDIKVKEDFTSYSVMPSAKNFEHSFDASTGVISVYLDKPEYFLIRLDDRDSSILSVFADIPEFPYEEYMYDPNTMVIDEWYEAKNGIMDVVLPNSVIYIAPGAVLNARLNVVGKGTKIIGRGAIVDPFQNIFEYNNVYGTNGNWMVAVTADKFSMEGVLLLDARAYGMKVNGDDCSVTYTKALSSIISSDGICLTGGENSKVEHCYMYVGDNAIVFSANNILYRDITIGTTCSAMYPQGRPNNAVLEDIHVFRADTSDGPLIRNIYNANSSQQTMNITVNNMYAVDCVRLVRLFHGQKMGTAEKVFTLKNIHLKLTDPTESLVSVAHGELTTGNYSLNITNIALNGTVLTEWKSSYSEYAAGSLNNKVTYKQEGEFTPVEHDSTTVNYKAPDKVFIGKYLVPFADDVLKDGNVFLLPYNQLANELYTTAVVDTEEKNGIKYVRSDKLVTSGMAKAVKLEDGALYITPNVPTNILHLDNGEVSDFVESWASNSDLKGKYNGDKCTYRITGTNTGTFGIVRVINDEIEKFGVGTYTVTFTVQSPVLGQIKVQNNIGAGNNAENDAKNFATTSEARTYSFTFEIAESQIGREQISIKFGTSGTVKLAYFEISDIILTKV